MKRIWDEGGQYLPICPKKYWVEADWYFPVLAVMYSGVLKKIQES